MRPRLTILRLCIVLALAGCAVLLADHFFAFSYCPLASECESVTSSAFGQVLGVPLSLIGLVGFALLLALSLAPQGRTFVLLRPLAILAGAVALALIAIQMMVLHQLCALCIIVDGAALVLALVSLPCRLSGNPIGWISRAAWIAVAIVAVVVPTTFGWLKTAHAIPERVKAYWTPGKITIVEVTDFDCPQCRAFEPVLMAFLARHAAEAHFIRIIAPSPHGTRSWSAARAYLAANAQGKGEQMAAALFAAWAREREGWDDLARRIGLNFPAYEKVKNDPGSDRQLEFDLAWAKTQTPGLPIIWIQDQVIFGVASLERLETAWQQAKHSAARQNFIKP